MASLRTFIKRMTQPFLKKGLQFYYRKPRKYAYRDIEVMVHPQVFPPHLTLSTKILLDFMEPLSLSGKSFLELGCGCGIISLFAAKKGAKVTASDINPIAIEYLGEASKTNKLEVACVLSNLFEKISEKTFDFIFINPPYYPKQPENMREQAWFCGSDFEYFKAMFASLTSYLDAKNKTYMILSEDCDIDRILSIASTNGISIERVYETTKMKERNFIFKVQKSQK